jgi:LPXTG-motif cell wall-anchored protein
LIEELSYQFDTDTNKITFSSDKFSTYGLVLGEQAPLPDTGDQQSSGWMMLLFGLILLLISSKKAIKE